MPEQPRLRAECAPPSNLCSLYFPPPLTDRPHLDPRRLLGQQVIYTETGKRSLIRLLPHPQHALKDLQVAPNQHQKDHHSVLITSRLDYRNTLYVGITTRLLKRLQTIQNSAARLIIDLPRWSLITPHLKKLH